MYWLCASPRQVIWARSPLRPPAESGVLASDRAREDPDSNEDALAARRRTAALVVPPESASLFRQGETRCSTRERQALSALDENFKP